MAWLEGSALGHVMRDSGVWFYGIINLTHILGVATLFGSVVILDLRLLGFWPDAPLAAISRPTTRMAAGGIRHRRRQWRGSARDQSDGICWQSVSLHQNSGHWTGLAQRVPRSPLIRLARAQEPRPDA